MTQPWEDPRSVLSRHGLQPKKSFGQNFLVSEAVVQRIAACCVPEPTVDTWALEIGAGVGTLTAALLARASKVITVERDRDLIPILHQEFAAPIAEGKLVVLEADAAQIDLGALLLGSDGAPTQRVLCGNLPYQITGRLIELATQTSKRLDRAVFMVQREVAERLMAKADSEAYGQASVFVQAAFEVEKLISVRAGSFFPAPRVDSTVVGLVPRAQPWAEETPGFRAVVHAAFGARRKTLRNALRAWLGNPEIAARVAATGIDLSRRGETLDVGEFALLGAALTARL